MRTFSVGLDEMWKSKMQGGRGNKKRFQYCTDSPGQEILYLRALPGHPRRNPIDPTLQDNVLIPDDFFNVEGGAMDMTCLNEMA